MNGFTIGLLAGLAAVLVSAAVFKLLTRNRAMSTAEKAEYLSKRRARMLPALAVIFLSQQATYFSSVSTPGPHSAETVKISAWLVLSAVLVAALATNGFWLQPKEIRVLIDDENTRANRGDAMRSGFLASMIAAIGVYVVTMFDPTVTAREAIHLIMSLGIVVAIVRWGWLERRAHRDA